MATFSHVNSRRMYSWWWDSHISPKNSQWLQENLTDMDSKVKSMIKLIEEDADSFKRRAEMYYKKRPELMKMVEEFYRAYRSLAERYDHATGVIRHAHRTMAEAFPNQVPPMLDDSPASYASGTDSQSADMSTPARAFLEPEELQNESLGLSVSHSNDAKRNDTFTSLAKFNEGKVRKSLKFHEASEREKSIPGNDNQMHEKQPLSKSESEQVGESEEILILKKALTKLEEEKEAGLIQYQQSLEKLSLLESEISRAQLDSKGLAEQASQADAEAQTLKEALAKLEAEKEGSIFQYRQCIEKISDLENTISHAQEDAQELKQRACKAEVEAQSVKDELAKVSTEKDAALDQYMSSLELISNLEHKLQCAEEDAKKLKEQAEKAENEVEALKQVISKLTEEKEAAELQYLQCLETISSLERNLSSAQDEAQRLNIEIENGITNFKGAEERCLLLERSNQSLHSEVEALMLKMGSQSQELTEKQKELGRLWTCVQEERLRFVEAETAFQTLQHLHAQAQEDLRSLASEVQIKVQTLRDSETQKKSLHDEVLKVKEENKNLNDLSVSSEITIKNLQNEISSLTDTKGKLEEEVELRLDQRNALQQEIYSMKEELNDLNRKNSSIMEQMHAVGLDAECFGSSVRVLQDENSKMKESCQRERSEKKSLLEKLEILEHLLEKNSVLENSLSDLNAELEAVRGRIQVLEESCQSLGDEKSSLLDEKASLQTQLQVANENLGELSEKNTALENSLFDAHGELEAVRGRIQVLEESCQSLGDEKSSLLDEKASLQTQLQVANENLGELSEKNTALENSLFDAHGELEVLKTKSMSLEECCLLLVNEKGRVVTEKDVLTSQLESTQMRLENLEERYAELGKQYSALEKEKELSVCKIQELEISLDVQKQEYSSLAHVNESQLSCMKNEVQHLQEEIKFTKREFDKELDNAFESQMEVFILRRCAQDLEDKNFCLSTVNQKLVETAIALESMLSDLKQDNMSQKVEIMSLSDEGSTLRKGIHKLLKALDIGLNHECEERSEQDQMSLNHILNKLEDTKSSFCMTEEENLHQFIELSVLLTMLGQLRIHFENLELEKSNIDREFIIRNEQLFASQNEALRLREMNEELKSKVTEGDHKEKALATQVLDLEKKLLDLQGPYQDLQRENVKIIEEKGSLTNEFLQLAENTSALEGENYVMCSEILSLDCLSAFLRNCVDEKSLELRELVEDLDKLNGVNDDIRQRLNTTERKLEEVLILKEMELQQIREENQKAKTKEENLHSELQMVINEVDMWEVHASDVFLELQVSNLFQILYEEKVHELTQTCEILKDENTTKDADIKLLRERVNTLEGQNEGLNDKLTAYVPAITSLRAHMSSLEEHTTLRGHLEVPENAKDDALVANHGRGNSSNDNEEVVIDPISHLQDLQRRIQSIEEAVTLREHLMMQENQSMHAELEAAMRQIADFKSENSQRRRNSKPTSEMFEVDNGLLTKDIMLDQVSEFSPYRISRGELVEADRRNIESWETGDQDGSIDLTVSKTSKMVENPAAERNTNFHRVKSAKKQKNEHPVPDVLIEKELSVDKLEISKRSTEPLEEGNKKKVLERLNSDVQKLTNLQITVQDLKKKLEIIGKSKKGKAIDECDILKEQLEEADAGILKLFDLNGKMLKNIEGTPVSSHSKSSMESEESGSVKKRRVSEQARRISERIGRLQLEVQKIQFVLLKLDDEKDGKGKSRIAETKRRVLLRDYLYGYGVIRSNHRRKKAPFCGCVQPRTEGD